MVLTERRELVRLDRFRPVGERDRAVIDLIRGQGVPNIEPVRLGLQIDRPQHLTVLGVEHGQVRIFRRTIEDENLRRDACLKQDVPTAIRPLDPGDDVGRGVTHADDDVRAGTARG